MKAVRWTFWVLFAWVLAAQVRVVFFPGTDVGPLFAPLAHVIVMLIGAALCLARAIHCREERVAWILIAAGVAAWTLGDGYYMIVLFDLEEIPVPSPADAGYLLMPPLLIAGLLTLLLGSQGRPARIVSPPAADAANAALTVAAFSAMLVVDAVAHVAEGELLSVATNLAYPLTDLVMLGILVGALAGRGWRMDRRWLMLGAGILVFWLADSQYLVSIANDTYEPESWFDAGWWVGLLLVARAAWTPAPAAEGAPEGSIRLIAMPLVFAGASLGLLIYGCFDSVNTLAVVLAATSLLAVGARLLFTFGENLVMLRASREEALSDALTGLGNRRALSRCLEECMARASIDSPLILVLFDLDGFKHYNDCYGHPAGDALLVRLGGRLRAFMDGHGHSFRMGGDEFCALFVAKGGDIEPIVAGAAAALSERGEGFSISCSYGAIELPREAVDPIEAVCMADQRMYLHKQSGRASAGRQSKDVLLRALAERNPELGSHLTEVADLAGATARALDLSDEDVERIRHAAELHDVGKVAIPDAILCKPGPLDDDEWGFIRRHTIIGERIVAAAPALNEVASLVRASHERWDGEGYPDRLAGDQIPLGSRIVAIADAFEAMTADRPYSPAMTPGEALAELRRCAGTQFDPVAVYAFVNAFQTVSRDQALVA